MIHVNKSKLRTASPEERAKAVEMVVAGATLREAAAAVGFTAQAVNMWVKAAELEKATLQPPLPRAPRKRRGPVFVNGVRLGRLALWT